VNSKGEGKSKTACSVKLSCKSVMAMNNFENARTQGFLLQ
jgi:hypothetical protein